MPRLPVYKIITFIFFLLIIYSSAAFFIYRKNAALLPYKSLQTVFRLFFLAVVFLYPLILYLDGSGRITLPEVLLFINSFWLAALLYLLLLSALGEAGFLIRRIIGLPEINASGKLYVFGMIWLFMIILLAGGYSNAELIRTRNINIAVPGKIKSNSGLRITILADLHLNRLSRPDKLLKLTEQINSTSPDIVLIAGDLIDHNLDIVIKRDLLSFLSGINSALGVFACAGNHDYISGGIDHLSGRLEKYGIRMLRDSVFSLPGISIIGRDEVSAEFFAGRKRKNLDEIMQGIPRGHIIIVMDHQPRSFNEAVDNGIDLLVSGHTHHGQLFPVNLITSLVFLKSYGLKNKNRTWLYVTSGAGTWGPPVRIGNAPEIAVITLNKQ